MTDTRGRKIYIHYTYISTGDRLQRSCPQCARRIHIDTSYNKQKNKQKQVEWTFSTFDGRLPGGKSVYGLAGQRGGLDISIVVVVFFHTFIFIFFVLVPAHSKTGRPPILRFVLSRVIADGSGHEDYSLPTPTTTPRDSYFAVERTC